MTKAERELLLLIAKMTCTLYCDQIAQMCLAEEKSIEQAEQKYDETVDIILEKYSQLSQRIISVNKQFSGRVRQSRARLGRRKKKR